ncbi:MAG: FAD-binding oxidoreductase [Terracidiphilus sp.]
MSTRAVPFASLPLEQAAGRLAEIDRLAEIVGCEHAHLCGNTVSAAPADAQQIAEVLRFANANGFIVTPTGGGTKLGWGNSGAPAILLSLARMNAVREHAWQDMTCTVEAGCRWSAMQTELARHGQTVALDPLWPDRATVGGIVSTNDSGALRLRYGPLRDLVLGMTVVLADGTIAKTGGKVVKNVAGYDLHKLMTGSYGTLGVIAEVNFRLHPVEEHARTFTAIAPDAAVFAEPLRALLDAQMTPSSVQLRAQRGECALDVRFAAVPACLDGHAARLRKILGEIAVNESSEEVWLARQNLFNAADAMVLKISTLPSEICSLSAELQQPAAVEGIEITSVAQAHGLTIVAIRSALKSAPDAAITFIEELRIKVRASGGSVVALQIPDAMRGRIDAWDCQSSALPLMREIKRRFDPSRILNPGRFVGGI